MNETTCDCGLKTQAECDKECAFKGTESDQDYK